MAAAEAGADFVTTYQEFASLHATLPPATVSLLLNNAINRASPLYAFKEGLIHPSQSTTVACLKGLSVLIKDNTINNPNFNPPKVAVGEIQAMLDCYTHMSDRKAKRAAEAAAAKANDKASDKVSPKGKGKPPKAADKPADPKAVVIELESGSEDNDDANADEMDVDDGYELKPKPNSEKAGSGTVPKSLSFKKGQGPIEIVKCPNCFKPFSSKHVCDAGPENQSTARKDNATESAIETRSAKFRKEKKLAAKHAELMPAAEVDDPAEGSKRSRKKRKVSTQEPEENTEYTEDISSDIIDRAKSVIGETLESSPLSIEKRVLELKVEIDNATHRIKHYLSIREFLIAEVATLNFKLLKLNDGKGADDETVSRLGLISAARPMSSYSRYYLPLFFNRTHSLLQQ
ncbi:hypothetical protein C8R47DRAFT_1197645 [Mycena vitilis]|nr:hypothetical protein C8R47DRAFT_1200651 [Mycena vitilis]KAJ6481418.1 hypothetical protein C8R47DRAFT_1197645 [Mycena vitilis]